MTAHKTVHKHSTTKIHTSESGRKYRKSAAGKWVEIKTKKRTAKKAHKKAHKR